MVVRDKTLDRLGMPSALAGAIEAHVDRFGKPPVFASLPGVGRERELADLIWVAIRVGKAFDATTSTDASVVRAEAHC
jgi:hypothetical protein